MGELIVFSKRCPKCGIHPQPSDMAWAFGDDWHDQLYCLGCRKHMSPGVVSVSRTGQINLGSRTITSTVTTRPTYSKTWDKQYVAFIPKLMGIPGYEIRESYLTPGQRKRINDEWRKSGVQCYVSDGERYWKWTDFPRWMHNSIDWDAFLQVTAGEWELMPDPDGLFEPPSDKVPLVMPAVN